jgi:formate dehydrogenase subunit delta
MTSADQGRVTSAEAKHGTGPGPGAGHGTGEHLVKMANDIGNFFRSEPNHKEAVCGIANHIAKFWTVRMRQKLLDYIRQHGEAHLDPLPREALGQLIVQPAAVLKPHEPGGDAG